jgi:AraC-like DNA-binding protein
MAPGLAAGLWDYLGPRAKLARRDPLLAPAFEALSRGAWYALTRRGVAEHFLGGRHPAMFSRRCTEVLGQPYVKIVLDFRLRQARMLLETGDEPVQLIAYAVGYPDLEVFCHAFRRHFGRSAAQVRRRARR